jgi:hypothetical protein
MKRALLSLFVLAALCVPAEAARTVRAGARGRAVTRTNFRGGFRGGFGGNRFVFGGAGFAGAGFGGAFVPGFGFGGANFVDPGFGVTPAFGFAPSVSTFGFSASAGCGGVSVNPAFGFTPVPTPFGFGGGGFGVSRFRGVTRFGF